MTVKFNTTWVALVIIVVVGLASYSNIFSNEFAFDDPTYILRWDAIASLSNVPALIQGEAPALHQHIYRPLRSIALAVVYAISKDSTTGYHVFSLLVHLTTSLLLYLLARKFLGKIGALAAGLFFTVLPVHVEAITFITASFEVGLGLVCMLASFFWYIRFRESKNYVWYALSLIFAVLAPLAHEQIFIYPFLLIGYDVMIRRESLNELRKSWIFYLPYVVSYAVLFWIRTSILTNRYHGSFNDAIPFLDRMYAGVKAIVYYLYLMIVNWPLTILHDIKPVPMIDGYVAVSSVALVALIALMVFLYKKDQTRIAFSIFWFLIALIPVSGVVQLATTMSERYLYIASVSWALFLGTIIHLVLKNNEGKENVRRMVVIAAAALILVYGAMTFIRNEDWHNDLTLYRSAIAHDTQFIKGYIGIAQYYRDIKEYDTAIKETEDAIQLNPDYYLGYVTLGEIYMETGDPERSIRNFKKAIELEPNYVTSYLNLGVEFYMTGQMQEAEDTFLKALEIYPEYYLVLSNLGAIYLEEGDYESSIHYISKAVTLRPTEAALYYTLAEAYEGLGDTSNEHAALEKAHMYDEDLN